jgi:gliding motility-associated lipoprotein GldD
LPFKRLSFSNHVIIMKKKLLLVVSVVCLAACGWWLFGSDGVSVPKQRGYFRIDLPEQAYRSYESVCPMKMEVSTASQIEVFRDRQSADSCWFNIYYPRYNARIHCTYIAVGNRFDELVNDAYGFAAKHEMKASGLRRTMLSDSARHVHGIIYDIEGDAASNVQFFMTDSTKHFLRGALYFFNAPNPDSIAPVLNFVRGDIERIAQTIEWR